MGLTPGDEGLHSPPEEIEGLWSDNFWFSVCDPEADVYGINHIHAVSSHGYQRVSAMFVIDGTHQQWASRQPLDSAAPVLGDGRLSFKVKEPFRRYRWTLDGLKFSFDLEFEGRFDPFDYNDCLGGNPLAAHEFYGGHYEQALICRGELEAHGGPRKGERRRIDSWAHRDHSWTHRFQRPSPWERRRPRTVQDSLGHFWPSIQLPDRHLNSFGWLNPAHQVPEGRPASGGWVADASGSRPIQEATGLVRLEDDARTAMSFELGFKLADGEQLTVRTGRKHAQTRNGLMRDENDAEVRLDCYEPFFDFEVLETGERGYGVVEYSIEPPEPRWRF
jgi:hypothetical protein